MGSHAVKALVVEVSGDEATVLGRGRSVASRGTEEAGWRELASAAEEALVRAEDESERTRGEKVVPDFALLGLGGWHVRGRSLAVKVGRRQAAEPVGEEEIQAALQRAQRLIRRELERDGEPPERLISLFSSVCSWEVDGRPVTSPLGFRGSTLGVRVFNALAPQPAVQDLRRVAAALELTVLGIVPSPCALALALEGEDALLIDAGGRWTDVVLVRAGRPWALGSLGLGGGHLTRALAESFQVSLARGEESKLAYAAGQLDQASAGRVREVLGPEGAVWLEGVAGLAAHLCRQEPGPHRIYVCGAASLLPDALEALQAYPWLEEVPLERYPEVRPLSPAALGGVRELTGRPGGPEHTPSLALARFAARMDGRLGAADVLPEGLLRR